MEVLRIFRSRAKVEYLVVSFLFFAECSSSKSNCSSLFFLRGVTRPFNKYQINRLNIFPEILKQKSRKPSKHLLFLSLKTPILNHLDFQNFVAVEVQEEDSDTSMLPASTILENSCFKAFSLVIWIFEWEVAELECFGIKLSFVSRNSGENTWLSQKRYEEISLNFLIILIFYSYRGNF